MSDFQADFAALLGSVRRPGSFVTGGARPISIPRIEVEGVGFLSFPLPSFQAEQLIGVAEAAPYGRGAQTVLDPAVRRAWQLPAERVQLDAPWHTMVGELLAEVRRGLAVDVEIEAQLYKLLVYEQGSFFLAHRDSVKAEGMFGTLVMVLPSPFEGGALEVSHGGRHQSLPMQVGFSELAWAAFYADCTHCLKPVTEGYRVALVYNLVRQGPGALPQVAENEAERARISALLAAEAAAALDDLEADRPLKRIYPLAHRYTAEELSFSVLKGEDAAAASVLLEAAWAVGWTVHLALVNIEQSGGAEVTWTRSGEAFEFVGDVEEARFVTHWVSPSGEATLRHRLPMEEGELCPADALASAEPDEVEFSEASGNEGGTFERAWRRAALVAWSDRHRLEVLEQGGAATLVPALTALTARFEAEGRSPALGQEAHRLAGVILRHLPGPRAYPDPGPLAGVTATLEAFLRLGDTERIEQLAEQIAGGPKWHALGNPALVAALDLLAPARVGALAAHIALRHAPNRFALVADLLDRLCVRVAPEHLGAAVEVLMHHLPGDPEQPAELKPWDRNKPDAAFVVALVRALEALDPSQAMAAVVHVLRWPVYDLDRVLLPAVLALGTGGAAFAQVHAAVVAHLEARIALPLEPPSDWARDALITCTCEDCRALNAFLADPLRPTWSLKAAKDARRHIEGTVRERACDVDLHTEERGRPFVLIATKNQASYERRCGQREKDLAHRARLVNSA